MARITRQGLPNVRSEDCVADSVVAVTLTTVGGRLPDEAAMIDREGNVSFAIGTCQPSRHKCLWPLSRMDVTSGRVGLRARVGKKWLGCRTARRERVPGPLSMSNATIVVPDDPKVASYFFGSSLRMALNASPPVFCRGRGRAQPTPYESKALCSGSCSRRSSQSVQSLNSRGVVSWRGATRSSRICVAREYS